jgi:multimeric flavodoxin WrbA
MKVVAVLGSPRSKGNSAFLAERFLAAAKKMKAETQSFVLNTLTYRGCQACSACKTTAETCVMRDDLTDVLEAVRQCDVFVLASPIYYGDVTGQMKLFIDRTFCYLTPDFRTSDNKSRLKPGKTLVFIQTQNAPAALFGDIFARYEQIMKYHHFAGAHLIRGCELGGPDDARNRADLVKLAEETARRVVGTGKVKG